MRLLIEQIVDQVDRHPAGRLVAGGRDRVDLKLELPTSIGEDELEVAAEAARTGLEAGVQALLSHRAAFQLGRVLCLRCRSARCEHATPTSPHEVFVGFNAAGTPRFLDFGQFLLERQDPRVDELFDAGGRLVTLTFTEEQLTGALLPSFRNAPAGYRIHGQVLAGWFRIPDPTGRPGRMALSFQLVSSQPRSSRRRYGLNLLGLGPGGEPLDHLHDRLRSIPWTGAVRWAQTLLRTMRRPNRRRLDGLISGFDRRLQRGQRATDRRTVHAEDRHETGERPTRMALADLERATEADLLFDRRRETVVVLGERGRCHVFSLAGKLVTSVRYAPASIAKRQATGIWRPATPEQIGTLREKIGLTKNQLPS